MNYLLEYFNDYRIMLFELIGLVIMIRISALVPQRIKRLTVVAAVLLFLTSVVFTLEKWTQSFETLSVFRPILTATVYSIYPVILLVIMQIINDKKLSKPKWALILLPEAVSVPVYYSSQWLRTVFVFTEENHYTGGFFPNWPYVVFGLYLAVFFVRNFVFFKNYSLMERIASVYILVASAVNIALVMFFGADDNLCSLFTSAIVLYYILMYIHMSKVDPLTKLFNRQSYYQDIKYYGGGAHGVISVDMNELKYLNDTFGHEAGDVALVAVSNAMKKCAGDGANVYRVGGDEFIILYNHSDESKLIKAVSDMRAEIAKTPYSCAFGYAIKPQGGNLEDAVIEADMNMYADKAAIKKEKLEKGESYHPREN